MLPSPCPAPIIQWCRDPARTEEIAAFFVAHAAPSYISHSELQTGRAEAPERWSADLRAIILAEAGRAIERAGSGDAGSGARCALATEAGRLVGLAFVTLAPHGPRPFAVLDDLLIAPEARGRGTGVALLDWIAEACRAAGCRRLFLESGLSNARAHHFFERHGFYQTSIVMMRDL